MLNCKLVERVPNAKALDLYRGADIVFDQCLIGFHGYFALEAWRWASGGRVSARSKHDVLALDECPLVNVRPETVETVIERSFKIATLARVGQAGNADT